MSTTRKSSDGTTLIGTTNLGKCGLVVSRICLGTMTFAREADEPTAFAIMDRYVERGGFFLDTANAYSNGASETVVGNWFHQRRNRDAIVLATKVFGRMGTGPNDAGLSRRHIMSAVDQSLKRLQTDYIDLYQIHRWDGAVPSDETARAMHDLVAAGKVRYIGASNLRAWQLLEYIDFAANNGLHQFASIQPVFNALNRGIEAELLSLCTAYGIGVVSYNPLGGGMLTGKYRKDQPPVAGSRMAEYEFYRKRYLCDESYDVVADFLGYAARLNMTPAQLALAWVLGDRRVTSPIVGARNLEQLNDSLGAVDRPLTDEQRRDVPAVLPGRWVGTDPVYDV